MPRVQGLRWVTELWAGLRAAWEQALRRRRERTVLRSAARRLRVQRAVRSSAP